MKLPTAKAGALVGSVASAVANRRRGSDTRSGEAASRWLGVTVYRPVDEVTSAPLPAPLAELGDAVEVSITKAPADRGTELRARLREDDGSGSRLTGDDPRQDIRAALRKSKQLLEVGEVLRVDPAPHGKRRATPFGKAVETAADHAGEEGVL